MADPLAAAAFDDVPSEESESEEVSDQESSEEELDSEEEAAQKKVRPSFRSASGSSRRAAMPEPGQGWAGLGACSCYTRPGLRLLTARPVPAQEAKRKRRTEKRERKRAAAAASEGDDVPAADFDGPGQLGTCAATLPLRTAPPTTRSRVWPLPLRKVRRRSAL